MKARTHEWSNIFLAVLPVVVVAAIGAAVTAPAIDSWYATLAKPSFNPPNWVFSPVWTILYALMALAVFRISRDGTDKADRVALQFYSLQLALNLLWSVAFFGLQQPGIALIILTILDLFVLLTLLAFGQRDRLAGYLLLPYLAWVLFATALNIGIVRLN